jgi:hypothetical protein
MSKTQVDFYQTTRRNIPEGSHLHSRRRKNLKSLHTCISLENTLNELTDVATDVFAGVMGETSGHSPADGWEIHVHERPEIPRDPSSAQR